MFWLTVCQKSLIEGRYCFVLHFFNLFYVTTYYFVTLFLNLFVNGNFGSLETCVIDLMKYCVTSVTSNSVLRFWGNPYGSVCGVLLISLIYLFGAWGGNAVFVSLSTFWSCLMYITVIMTVQMKHFNILINKIFMYVSVWKFYVKDSNWFVHILSYSVWAVLDFWAFSFPTTRMFVHYKFLLLIDFSYAIFGLCTWPLNKRFEPL